jgi:hypothetical protein
MRRKWCHCVRLVLLIPAVYLLSQTESVWRSYRDLFAEPNRQKFDADCTCPYSPYESHVAVTWPYIRDDGGTGRQVMWHVFIGSIVANMDCDTWHFGANDRVPRGPIKGCHVAPRVWTIWSFIKIYGGHGVRPPDLPSMQRFQ